MASILFDDIAFPRELYDPDTLEFVPPISTLLSFTPHILSQLPLPEAEQEPLPEVPSTSTEHASTTTSQQRQHANPKRESSASKLFATLKDAASSQAARQLLSDGAHLAGRYMSGATTSPSSSSSSSYRRTHDDYYYTRLRREDEQEQEHARGQAASAAAAAAAAAANQSGSSSSFFNPLGAMFGFRDTSAREQEQARLRELEARLAAFEREYEQQDMYSRREQERINQERRQLVQELNEHKERVEKLERALQEEQEAKKKKKQEEEEEQKKKKREQEEKQKSKGAKKEQENEQEKKPEKEGENGTVATASKKDAQDPLVMTVVGAASLVMAMYAAHRASTTYSAISFHDQLEVLLGHCQSAIQSAEAWMSEQVLEVPQQMREDVKLLKELMDAIQRLDPRGEKKAETVAWSMSALGSLSVVGGVALSSMTAVASGGTLVVGCALYGIVSRARYRGPEYNAARTMMELKVGQLLKVLGTGDYNPALQHAASNPSQKNLQVGQVKSGGQAYQRRLEMLRLEFQRRACEDVADADEVTDLRIEDELRHLRRAERMAQSQSSSSTTSSPRRSVEEGEKVGDHRRHRTTTDDAELLFDAGDLHGIKASTRSSSSSTQPNRLSQVAV